MGIAVPVRTSAKLVEDLKTRESSYSAHGPDTPMALEAIIWDFAEGIPLRTRPSYTEKGD